MKSKYLYVNAETTSGRVSLNESNVTVNMGGINYDTLHVISCSINDNISIETPVVRLLGTEGNSTNLLAGAVVAILDSRVFITGDYSYSSSNLHVCVSDLDSRQNLTFQFYDATGNPIDMQSVSSFSILLELY